MSLGLSDAYAGPIIPPIPDDGATRGPGYDPLRKTVCRSGCEFESLSDAIAAVEPNSSDIISILDGFLEEQSLIIDLGKSVTISGLGAQRTKIGLIPDSVSSIQAISRTRVLSITDGAHVTLKNLAIWGGDAGSQDGGAIYVSGSDSQLHLDGVDISQNSARSGGGIAIADQAAAIIENSIIDSNIASEHGGGVHISGGQITLTTSFVGHNSAAAGGGLFFLDSTGNSLIQNSTLGFNSANNPTGSGSDTEGGSAIYISSTISPSTNSKVDMRFSTISQNQTMNGTNGTVVVSGGTLNSTATIVMGNTHPAGSDQACNIISGDLVSNGNNVSTDSSCFSTSTDVVSSTVSLGDFGYWGGRTPTFEITPDSGAVGLVNFADCIDIDQKGLPRMTDDRCDAGAYEAEKYLTFCPENSCSTIKVKPDQLIVTETDDPAPDGCEIGDCSLREAIMDAERHPGRDEIVFATNGPIALTIQGIGGAEVGDLNIIGELSLMGNITDVITIDASALDDRIFEIGVGAVVDMTGFLLTGGNVITGTRGGGAILNQGTFTGEHLLIRNNKASIPNFGWGGAVQSAEGADFTLRSSEIISNSTSSFFSGIANWNSTMELTGVTIAGNDGNNGVVYNLASGGDSVLWLNSVTLAANEENADSVFGLSNRWQDFPGQGDNPEAVITYMHNTVIGQHKMTSCDASGSSGNNIAKIVSLDFNLTFDDSCQIGEDNDLVDTDPLLGPLEQNTMGKYNGRLILKPLPLSPLYNQGDTNGCPDEDGRGIGRPGNDRCDIGAVELTGDEEPAIIYLSFIGR